MNLPNEAIAFSQWLHRADKSELSAMLAYYCEQAQAEEIAGLNRMARQLRDQHYGRRVFFRGLIEYSNYCKNDCYYCGLRKSNRALTRYRLEEADILDCCRIGHELGFRTFVLQGGEDKYFNDTRACRLVTAIKQRYPDCALTLSLGERSYQSYQRLFEAGADRYLLRHETADAAHYRRLHPANLSLEQRQQCLYDLKRAGFQVGAGLMVQSPFQTYDTLADDLVFMRGLKPHMVGIGPFIPQHDTPFRDYALPTAGRTLLLLSLTRLLLPKALMPATTALGTIDALGREKGLQAGANVLMPNLSPLDHRQDYALYDNKISTGEEAAEGLGGLVSRIQAAGYIADFSRGDHADFGPAFGSGQAAAGNAAGGAAAAG